MTHAITERCTGCTACARQCPTQAISGLPDRQHRIDAARCIDCGVCGWVCPAPEAVVDGDGQAARYVPRSLRPRPEFHSDECNGCGACVDICPFGVLEVVGPRYRGIARLHTPDACVSCGECASACPRPSAIRLNPGHPDASRALGAPSRATMDSFGTSMR